MTDNFIHLVGLSSQLTRDEYLRFLIHTHYKHYEDKDIYLSVYDVHKKLQFATKLTLDTFDMDQLQTQNQLPREMKHLQKHRHIINEFEEIMEHVLNTGTPSICIIFDTFNDDLFGAMHMRSDPIFTHQNEICGICHRSYDFTRLYFGGFALPHENRQLGLKSYRAKINYHELNERQKQILFLLAMNFTQDAIAETFQITRGTIARIIARICQKFDFEFTSARYLIEYLGRDQIVSNLTLPKAMVKPCIIKITDNLNKTNYHHD